MNDKTRIPERWDWWFENGVMHVDRRLDGKYVLFADYMKDLSPQVPQPDEEVAREIMEAPIFNLQDAKVDYHPDAQKDISAIIARHREAATAELRKTLASIAANTCCDKCQEASMVARAALQQGDPAHD